MSKYAIIINGDTEPRHLKNVDRAINSLKSDGYEVFVADVEKPKARADHYNKATLASLTTLVDGLKTKITSNDELVIYTTGHGDEDKQTGEGKLCLEKDSHDEKADRCQGKVVADLLDSIAFKQRVVVMDNCYGGNWKDTFLNDPRTLFISGGSPNETDVCQESAPRLWAPKSQIKDSNRDGKISWSERFAHLMEDQPNSSFPQFMASKDFEDIGKEPTHSFSLSRAERLKSIAGKLESADPKKRLKGLNQYEGYSSNMEKGEIEEALVKVGIFLSSQDPQEALAAVNAYSSLMFEIKGNRDIYARQLRGAFKHPDQKVRLQAARQYTNLASTAFSNPFYSPAEETRSGLADIIHLLPDGIMDVLMKRPEFLGVGLIPESPWHYFSITFTRADSQNLSSQIYPFLKSNNPLTKANALVLLDEIGGQITPGELETVIPFTKDNRSDNQERSIRILSNSVNTLDTNSANKAAQVIRFTFKKPYNINKFLMYYLKLAPQLTRDELDLAYKDFKKESDKNGWGFDSYMNAQRTRPFLADHQRREIAESLFTALIKDKGWQTSGLAASLGVYGEDLSEDEKAIVIEKIKERLLDKSTENYEIKDLLLSYARLAKYTGDSEKTECAELIMDYLAKSEGLDTVQEKLMDAYTDLTLGEGYLP